MVSRCVITIGNFDGVHLGHASIIARAAAVAHREGASVKVFTFDPHPAGVLRPGQEPPRLSSLAEKVALLHAAGADQVIVLEPTRELLALEPREFILRLFAEHHPIAFVEGIDFRFGKARVGDVQVLSTLGGEFGFEVVIVPDEEVALSDHLLAPVSSSLIRWLLARGRVRDVAICLGREFALRGTVVQGDQRGRLLGVPTANLSSDAFANRAVPGDGVYAGIALLPDGSQHAAAISVGTKPTFNGTGKTIEAYLLNFAGDLYGRTITFRFSRWLRDQQPFPSLDTLKAQLQRDIDEVARLNRLHSLACPPRQ